MEYDIASHLLEWHKLSTERTMLYLYSGSWCIGMLRIYGKGILSMTRVQKRPARRKSRGQQNKSQQLYDNALKALMEDHAAEIIPEFVPEAAMVIEQNNEIKRENIRADLVYLVEYKGQLHVLNMELQTDRDSNMAARMLKYHVELHLAYQLPVISVVLYLFETSIVASPYKEVSGDENLLIFHYRVIALWTLDAEEYVKKRIVCMYTFLPGMKRATVSLLIQAMDEMRQRYTLSQLARHLSRFKTILQRSNMLSEEDKQRVEDHMQVYDSLLDGQPWFEQRLAKKAAESELQVLQQLALEAVDEQFPPLAEFAREKITSIRQPDVLRLLVKQIYKAPDEATARWLLNTLPSQSDTK